MINHVGREIPDQFLTEGKEAFQGQFYRDGYTYRKASPTVRAVDGQRWLRGGTRWWLPSPRRFRNAACGTE